MFIEKVDYFDGSGLMCDRFGEVYRWFWVNESDHNQQGYLLSVADVLTLRQVARKEAQQYLLQWEWGKEQEHDDAELDDDAWLDSEPDSLILETSAHSQRGW